METMLRLIATTATGMGRIALVGWMMMACCGAHAAKYRPAASPAGDDLFVTGVVPQLAIEIPPDSLATLRAYHQVWRQARPQRIDVRITIREGALVYTNVAAHLKGSFSYRDVDDKPSLTLNFDKFAPGQRFHGLEKIHLNNSVQDPSYLCEKLAREMFLAAGVPAARIGHARVSLNDRALGFYVLDRKSTRLNSSH